MSENSTLSAHKWNETVVQVTATKAPPAPSYFTLCIFAYTPKYELLLVHILKLYVNTIISVIGFSANMVSIVILRKSGLGKPSNILLLGLVVADSMTQLQTMNFAEILQELGPNYRYPAICGWQYGDGVNYFLLACDGIFLFFTLWGQYVNTTIPIFITVERFLAVYMPLTFKRIITPKAAWICVIIAYLIWLPWIIFALSLFRIVSQLPGVVLFAFGFKREESFDTYILLNDYVCTVLSTWVPIAFIGTGCILIGVKVKVTLAQRRKLTSSKEKVPWSAKTTRTLLTTCSILFIFLTISAFVGFFEAYVPNGYFYFMYEILSFITLLNASSNFFVYIGTNGQFLSIFKSIFLRKKANILY